MPTSVRLTLRDALFELTDAFFERILLGLLACLLACASCLRALLLVVETRTEVLRCSALSCEATCVQIEKHLATCTRCAGACDALRRTVSLCRRLPGDAVPADVRAAVRGAILTVISPVGRDAAPKP